MVLDGHIDLRWQSGLVELKYRRKNLSKLATITRNQSFQDTDERTEGIAKLLQNP